MRLLKPSLGEIIDRLTILELKIIAVQDNDARIQDLREFIVEKTELKGLAKALTGSFDPSVLHVYGTYVRSLSQVNERLWRMEDEIRALRKKTDADMSFKNLAQHEVERVMALAFLIPETNDVRANLINKINALLGSNTNEKIYK